MGVKGFSPFREGDTVKLSDGVRVNSISWFSPAHCYVTLHKSGQISPIRKGRKHMTLPYQ